ncbi:hypothetical protein ACJIZ3_017627 [Penstemon smallii]|uniref:Aquaporin NIP7-1 n=1 Tax=Penstemon smallii TaxID=265156 RepID=A0ABD3SWJ7_9LAMI
MKIQLQDSSSLDVPISTSKSDQELGYTTSSSNENVAIKKAFFNFPYEIDTSLVRMVLAEAIGTFILMFCIGGIIANMSLMGIKSGLVEYAATAGLTVIIVVSSIGSISGAHVNPAVTIAFATVGPFPWSKVPLYILAQVGGSVLATYSGRLVYGIKPEIMMTRPLHGCTEAFWVELIATFIILFLTTSLFNEPQSPGQLSAFLAGVAIGLGVLISGPVSGGSMNPARSLGPALVSWRFDHLWIYLVAPTIGAISGVFVYRILRLKGWSCKFDPSQKKLQVSHTSLY